MTEIYFIKTKFFLGIKKNILFLFFCLILFNKSIHAQTPELVLPVGHTHWITSAEFSPDGKYLLTSSFGETTKIWEVSSGKLLHTLTGHSNYVFSANFSPDGKYVVTAGGDSTGKIWDAETGSLLRTLMGHSAYVESTNFSPKGKYIVTTSDDKTAKIWEANTGKLLYTLSGNSKQVTSANFSPDSKYVVTTSTDNLAKIWDANNGKLLYTLSGKSRTVSSADFSIDGKYLITASLDSTAKIWEVNTGKLIHTLKGHSDAVWSANFSPDGKCAITTSADNTAKIWEVSTGELLHTLKGHSSDIGSANFSRDGQYVVTASSDNTAKIWEVSTGKLLHTVSGHSQPLGAVNFSQDGKYVVTASYDRTAKIWEVNTGKLLHTLSGHSTQVESTNFSPDGKYVVTASADHTAKIWEVNTGKLLHTLSGHSKMVSSANFSPDGKYVVTSSGDSTAKIWEVETGKLLYTLSGYSSWVNSANFSYDGKYIITASADTTKIWEVSTDKILHTFSGHIGWIWSANFSPDGKYFVTASSDKTAKIWEVTTGDLLQTLEGHTDVVVSANFSPDGKYVITTSWDKSSKIWEVNSGKVLRTFSDKSNGVNSAVFSPDGNYILTASSDGTAKTWEVNSGKLQNTLGGNIGIVESACFSSNEKYILTTCGADQSIYDSTGKLIYKYILVDSTDWLAIDAYGRFDGTPNARKQIYYVCGDEIIDLDQIKTLCWEPGLVEKLMGVNKEPITAKKLTDLQICDYTPVVSDNESTDSLTYKFEITERKGGIGNAVISVNGKEVITIPKEGLKSLDSNRYLLIIKREQVEPYFVPGQDNNVSVYVTTASNEIKSRGMVVDEPSEENKKLVNPDLYAVVVGISDYKSPALHLNYAAKDAKDFSSALQASATKLFDGQDGKEHVHIYTFNGDTGQHNASLLPLKQNLSGIFDSINKKATSSDIVVVFFAGHGMLSNNNFYFLTADASGPEIAGVEKEVAISTTELADWLKINKAQKQVVILDACHSGQAVQDLYALKRDIPSDQQRELDRLNSRTGTFILSASAADQSAYESSSFGQGLLTYSLLNGIKTGEGLRDGQYVDVSKWFYYAEDEVTNLAKGINGLQEPQVFGQASFDIGKVDSSVLNKIKLSSKKIMFTTSNFHNESNFRDNLSLGKMMDNKLNELNYQSNSSMGFSASDEQNVYSINGAYNIIGNAITVKVLLLYKEDKKYDFIVNGTMDNLSDLSKQIVNKVVEWMGK